MRRPRKGRVVSTVLPLMGVCLASGCLKPPGEKAREAETQPGLAEPSHVTEQNGETVVTLDSATAARIGLRTVVLRPATGRRETELAAMVVADPEATSYVRAGLSGRLAVPEGGMWPRFGARLEAGAVVGVVGDARPIAVPRAGTVSRVLAQPGELVQAGQQLLEITQYDAPLIQVAWSGARAAPPAWLPFAAATGGRRVRGTLVGPAPEADPVTRGPAWLYRVEGGWRGMRPGAGVTAYLADEHGVRRGVLVPSEAVVQWDALVWAYQEKAPGRYVRVRVATDLPVEGGWVVGGGLSPGDRVVTTGAGQLLSEEFRARIVVGEEVGE
jgi:multidrug efflux pump subunit AcrA (membrane-fusion protein)